MLTLTTHCILRYNQRFSPVTLLESTVQCRKELMNAQEYTYDEIKEYLKPFPKTHFDKVRIFDDRIFVIKKNKVVTTLTARQFFDSKYQHSYQDILLTGVMVA